MPEEMTAPLQNLLGVGGIPNFMDEGFLWRLEAVLVKFRIVYSILIIIMNPPLPRETQFKVNYVTEAS